MSMYDRYSVVDDRFGNDDDLFSLEQIQARATEMNIDVEPDDDGDIYDGNTLIATFEAVDSMRAAVSAACGMRYDSPEAAAILNQVDWSQHWPLVDSDGDLTGEITDCDDNEEYANLNDIAMILVSDMTDEQLAASGGESEIRESGYGTLGK